MKNFEAYEDEIRLYGCNFARRVDNTLTQCAQLGCEKCKFGYNFSKGLHCGYMKAEWLYEEYKKSKVKITLTTKAILESLNDNWNWIVRDKNNDVICFENKPVKGKMIWVNNVMGGKIHNLTYILKSNPFEFLSWEDEEPTNIKELLENCEVID